MFLVRLFCSKIFVSEKRTLFERKYSKLQQTYLEKMRIKAS